MTASLPHNLTMLTADDLATMPDDGFRYELDEGELVRLPLSSFNSSSIAATIVSALIVFARPHALGRVAGADGAYILTSDPATVRIPDVSFVRADRLPPKEQWGCFLALAPDLAVEVVSPSDTVADVLDKVREYLDAGVRLIWVVQPSKRMVTVYTQDRTARVLYEDDTLDGGDVLPDFRLPVADVFV
ncbi:MAG TPA: Uma2 family endonuclease [Thermomicrobiales bacterium]|nr:Uma2 family endonuclease [Thermomicrobiales bacterium]